jgi:hypothetical protein
VDEPLLGGKPFGLLAQQALARNPQIDHFSHIECSTLAEGTTFECGR